MNLPTPSSPPPLHSFSPSEISVWRECERKWGYKYLERRRTQAESAALGEIIHTMLEKYLLDGTQPDPTVEVELTEKDGTKRKVRPGLIAQAGLHLIPPPPQPVANLEGAFSFDAFGFRWKGRVDLFVKGLGPWLVYDHKSTKDFRYAKTPAELASDPQGVIYATYAMLESGEPEVDLSWVYYRTKGRPDARRVHLRVVREDIVPHWEELRKDATAIAAARGGESSGLAKNLLSCANFGGCPFREECLTPMSQQTDKFEEFLQSRQANRPAARATPSLAPPPPPPPVIDLAPELPIPELPEFAIEMQGDAYTGPPTPPPPPSSDPYDLMNRTELKAEAVSRGLLDASSKLGEAKLRELLRAAPPISEEEVLVGLIENDPVLTEPPPAPTAPEIPVIPEAPSPPAPVAGGFTLYIDCMPVHGMNEEVVHAQSFLADVYDIAAESVKLPDYRLADYGKGPGIFRAHLKAWLEANRHRLDGKAIVITAAGSADAIPTLEQWAARIVRGLR